MVLQDQGQFLRVSPVYGYTPIRRRAPDRGIVLYQDPVVDHGNPCRRNHTAAAAEDRCGKNDIVRLPFARRQAGIDQRGYLFVDRSRLAIAVGLMLVGIQHLNFIQPLEKDAAVASILAFFQGLGGATPFDM